MNRGTSGIVADGMRRLGRARDSCAVRSRLLAEARMRRRGKLRVASFWSGMAIRWEIELEVAARMAREFPSGALYAASPGQ